MTGEPLADAMLAGADLAPLLADDVAFYSPAYAEPATGAALVAKVLSTAAAVYGTSLRFTDRYTSSGSTVVFLAAVVDGHDLAGCYRIERGDAGLIVRIDALFRPLAATEALVRAMMRRLA